MCSFTLYIRSSSYRFKKYEQMIQSRQQKKNKNTNKFRYGCPTLHFPLNNGSYLKLTDWPSYTLVSACQQYSEGWLCWVQLLSGTCSSFSACGVYLQTAALPWYNPSCWLRLKHQFHTPSSKPQSSLFSGIILWHILLCNAVLLHHCV